MSGRLPPSPPIFHHAGAIARLRALAQHPPGFYEPNTLCRGRDPLPRRRSRALRPQNRQLEETTHSARTQRSGQRQRTQRDGFTRMRERVRRVHTRMYERAVPSTPRTCNMPPSVCATTGPRVCVCNGYIAHLHGQGEPRLGPPPFPYPRASTTARLRAMAQH